MPTYEYACRDCDTRLEVVQSFKDDPLEVCDACGGSLRKVFSAAGIIFKGSGYYVTDTRGDRGRSSSTGESSGGSSSDDASTKPSDSTSSTNGTSSDTKTSSTTTSTSDAKSA